MNWKKRQYPARAYTTLVVLVSIGSTFVPFLWVLSPANVYWQIIATLFNDNVYLLFQKLSREIIEWKLCVLYLCFLLKIYNSWIVVREKILTFLYFSTLDLNHLKFSSFFDSFFLFLFHSFLINLVFMILDVKWCVKYWYKRRRLAFTNFKG